MNIICTICSDLVNQAENIHVTRCGHVFHYHCLVQWIDRSKTCPQCRNKVTKLCMFRIYPTVTEDNSTPNAATLQSQLDNVKLELRQQKAVTKEKDETIAAVTTSLKKHEDMISMYQKKLACNDSKLRALEDRLAYANIQCKETQKLKEENEALKKNMQTLNGLQKVLNATADDVEHMLQCYTEIGTIAVFATALKRALCESEAKKNECRDRLHAAKQQLALKTKSETDLQIKVTQLEEDLNENKQTIQSLQEQLKSAQTNNSSAQVVEVDVHAEKSPRKKRDWNTAMSDTNCDISFNTMVNNIENSDSPYLNLKQAGMFPLTALQRTGPFITPKNNVNTMVNNIENSDSPYLNLKQAGMFPLTALQRTGPFITPKNNVTLDEVYLRNCVKNIPKQNGIFHKKETLKMTSNFCPNITSGLTYDGMGGHSKPDEFPVPQKQSFKSCVPKITAKHKLKRPIPTGSQNIKEMLKRSHDK